MKRHALVVLAYLVATFGIQALSHFVFNVEHYGSIPYMRAEPIFALGLASMIIQGSIFSYLYSRLAWPQPSITHALTFSWLVGGVLLSYIVLAEPAKYAVPSVPRWVLVEALAGFAQFTLFGLLLALVYRGARAKRPAPAAVQ
jgi:hypothetical protein